MARSKKTISVSNMIDYANANLARTDAYATKEFKIGVTIMIEEILHRTDNYWGFMFINNDDSKTDSLGYYTRKYFKSHKL